MSLNIKPLNDAVAQLEVALNRYDRELPKKDPELQRLLRSATIQAFEFTYEIAFKMLKRHLVHTASSPEAFRDMTFDNVVREAFGRDLVCSEISVWRVYRQNRAITSHTYDEDKAQEVFDCAKDFLQDARYTLSQLQERNKPLGQPD